MKKQRQYSTVTQAIDFVLWESDKPLLTKEIIKKIPNEKVGRKVPARTVWATIIMMTKRKYSPIVKEPCFDEKLIIKWCFKAD